MRNDECRPLGGSGLLPSSFIVAPSSGRRGQDVVAQALLLPPRLCRRLFRRPTRGARQEFLTYDADFVRRFDAEANFPSGDLNNGHDNGIGDDDALAELTGQYQHAMFLLTHSLGSARGNTQFTRTTGV